MTSMIVCGKFPKLGSWNSFYSVSKTPLFCASFPLMSRIWERSHFMLLPLNWISHLPPKVCASGPVFADNQTNGPLHEVDGIQHQRREQFGLDRCQTLFVLIQIPACTKIFLIAASAHLLHVGKIKTFAHEVVQPLSPVPEWKWWCGAAYDVGDHLSLSNAGASGEWKCIKLSTHQVFSSASISSTLHLFLSHNQQTKLRTIIAIMGQEGVARRWERKVPAEFS